MANSYEVGDTIRIVASFSASPNQVADPAAVYFLLRPPEAEVITYNYPASIVQAATGAYYVDVVASRSGEWKWRFEGVLSGGRTAIEDGFAVRWSAFYL